MLNLIDDVKGPVTKNTQKSAIAYMDISDFPHFRVIHSGFPGYFTHLVSLGFFAYTLHYKGKSNFFYLKDKGTLEGGPFFVGHHHFFLIS